MTSSIDTNVLVALMDSRAEVTAAAKELIVAAAFPELRMFGQASGVPPL
jgi:predicted nucleic acid-binding protein